MGALVGLEDRCFDEVEADEALREHVDECAGVDRLLQKPFDAISLGDALRNVLDRD